MKRILLLFIMITSIGLAGCTQAEAENPAGGDSSADVWISPTFTTMNLVSGVKSGERISEKDFKYYKSFDLDLNTWNPQNGDIFFFRGEIVQNPNASEVNAYDYGLAVVPLEEGFYWNGVGLYYEGFLYRIMQTENGLRIYNSGLWTIKAHCLIVQAGSSLALPELGINTEMLKNIHKLKVRRGHLKVAEMNPNIEGAFTPPGLLWKYYKNQGKEIRPTLAGEYLKAEDFIAKTDFANGYFKSLTPELQIKNIHIYSIQEINLDCPKVY